MQKYESWESVVSIEQQLRRENTGKTISREGIIDWKFAAKQEFCHLSTACVVSAWKWNARAGMQRLESFLMQSAHEVGVTWQSTYRRHPQNRHSCHWQK
jgi:hypothetical protein